MKKTAYLASIEYKFESNKHRIVRRIWNDGEKDMVKIEGEWRELDWYVKDVFFHTVYIYSPSMR